MNKSILRTRPWTLIAVASAVVIFAGLTIFVQRRSSVAEAANADSPLDASPAAASVVTSHPQSGGLERTMNLPATVIAFESADLFAKLSGYLKTQTVDIGDRVRKGQVLAEIDSSEYVKAVDQATAAQHQARAQVAQADSRITTAQADSAAAASAVKKAETDVLRYRAVRELSEKELARYKDLYALKTIEQRVVDEQESDLATTRSAEEGSRASVENARALAAAAAARIEQAKADADAARANLEVADAALARAAVFVSYLKIVAPFDGVVTNRNFFRGDYISSGDMQGRKPLLTIDRTDSVRVIVEVPDCDVPLIHPGSMAEVSIDALPGAPFRAKISRLASAEHSETRTMRAEIDIENEKGLLCHGMYGYVSVNLPSPAQAMRIPVSAVVETTPKNVGTVHLVKDGLICSAKVRLGQENGAEAEVLQGLSPDDEVVVKQSGELADGAAVNVTRTAAREPSAHPKLAANAGALNGTL